MKEKNVKILIAFLCLISSSLSYPCYAQLTSRHADPQKELRLCRNEIYARHGRQFSSEDLKKSYSAQSWYKPNDHYRDELLSEREILAANTILKLEKGYTSFNERQKKIAHEILDAIRVYYKTEIDKKYLTIGNFDGIPPLDTIQTHITEKGGSIKVEYFFLRNALPIWSTANENPYLFIGQGEILEELQENFFTTLSNATNHCIAEIWKKPAHYQEMKVQWAFRIGISELKQAGINISEETYQKFIDNFKADLLIHSQDEGGGSLQLWYEPAKRFLTFYAP